jgi:hypothetical protein
MYVYIYAGAKTVVAVANERYGKYNEHSCFNSADSLVSKGATLLGKLTIFKCMYVYMSDDDDDDFYLDNFTRQKTKNYPPYVKYRDQPKRYKYVCMYV